VLSGKLRLHFFPGTRPNLDVYVRETSRRRRGGGHLYKGRIVFLCGEGDAVVIPAGWLVGIEFQEATVACSAVFSIKELWQ
jgi:hypothetical protein